VFGVTPHAVVPLADFGQLELGVQGVEHDVPFLSVVVVWWWVVWTEKQGCGRCGRAPLLR
jgi:hypothetical protein